MTETQKAPAPVEQAFYLLIECSTAFRIAARNLKMLDCYNASRRDTEEIDYWVEAFGGHAAGADQMAGDLTELYPALREHRIGEPADEEAQAIADAAARETVAEGTKLLQAFKQLTEDEPEIKRAWERYYNRLSGQDLGGQFEWLVENPPPTTVAEAHKFLGECDEESYEGAVQASEEISRRFGTGRATHAQPID